MDETSSEELLCRMNDEFSKYQKIWENILAIINKLMWKIECIRSPLVAKDMELFPCLFKNLCVQINSSWTPLINDVFI